VISFPDGVARRLHDPWREKLKEAQLRYTAARNEENRAEYLRVLKAFSDLVLRSKIPEEI
jgi:hypothetical protein